ncbi:UNVERIFIED_CONTAM: Cation/H(+) antiporter 24 [Sesamum angustifolium]|uniref:Cation/H(+) antiporter 24 n=1 Tax=Sesamum angustifolium TaxID=2727405 RepID=A0AAW2QRU1_9LAMI
MFPDNADYVIKNLGVMGFMYFLFMAGVKMDLTLVRRVDKKHWYIALVGVLVPLIGSLTIALMVRKSLEQGLAKASSIWGVTSSLAITAFPVLYSIVKELNLVSSEIGRMALSSAVIGDVIGITGVIIFEATKQGEHRPIAALFYLISLAVFMASIMGGVRQAMLWIVRTTPEGKPVDQIYVIAILLSVMVSGFSLTCLV